jgi:Arc/MetJ-type ribon-helix-helix transcriptional regulator
MPTSISVLRKKKRGRPATGTDPIIPIRLPPEMVEAIDAWGKRERIGSRSEAVRRLVDLGLLAKGPHEMKTRVPGSRVKSATKAANMAGKKIDQLDDKSASDEVRAQRKRRLIKGPSEFRQMRGTDLTGSKNVKNQ